MIALLVAPTPDPAILAWLAAYLAAAGGIALHILFPPRDPAIAEALLVASVHP